MRKLILFFVVSMSVMTLQAQCPAVNVPYTENFESVTIPNMPSCVTLENAGLGNNWATAQQDVYSGSSFPGRFLRYRKTSSQDANAWFYTSGVNLVANTTYKISYNYGKAFMTISTERLKVAYGTSASVAGMTTVLANHPNIIQGGALSSSVEFTPTVSGIYYFGFNAYSSGSAGSILHVDNIKVVSITPPVITSFTPGTECGSSTMLKINGTGLTGATVTIGGTAITLESNTQEQITANISTSMVGNIVVTTATGTTTSATPFTFTTTPALSLSNAATVICEGSSSSPVTMVTGATDYTTYGWSPDIGVTGNSTSGWTFNPTVSTTYVLNASNPTTGCTNSANYSVEITSLPTAVTTTSDTIEVCQHATSAIATAGSTLVPVSATQIVSFGSDLDLPAATFEDDLVAGVLNLNAEVSLPTGAVVTSTKLVFNDISTAQDVWVSFINAGMSGVINMDQTAIAEIDDQVINGGPYEIVTDNIPNTGGAVSLVIENLNEEGAASFGNISLVIEYTISGTVNMTWWNAASEGTQIGTGTTLETIGTNVLPNAEALGTYTVYAQASNGVCVRPERKAIAVVVKPNPEPVITAPTLSICDGSSLVLTSSATTGNVWSTNETTSTISVSTAGSYSVVVTNDGCTGTSAPAIVTVISAPVAAATLTGNTTITATPAGQNYQWINCTTNTPVTGATSATFTATANGSYKVIVTNAEGCKDTSACVNVSKVGLAENSVDLGITLYPNPTEGNVFVSMKEAEKVQVTVFDVQGKTVLTMDNIQNGAVISLNHVQNGIYMVKVSNEKGANVYRVVKN